MLVDSGNRSEDLIDFEVWKKAFPKIPLLPLDAKIEMAQEGQFLNIVGRPHKPIEIHIEGVPKPWLTRPVVIRQLGAPAIWSAKSMKNLPIIPNLQKGIALIGPEAHRVQLYPDQNIKEIDDSTLDETEEKHPKSGKMFIEDLQHISSSRNLSQSKISKQTLSGASVTQSYGALTKHNDLKTFQTDQQDQFLCLGSKEENMSCSEECLINPETTKDESKSAALLDNPEVNINKTIPDELLLNPGITLEAHDEIWEVRIVSPIYISANDVEVVQVRLHSSNIEVNPAFSEGLYVPISRNSFKTPFQKIEFKCKKKNWISEIPIWNESNESRKITGKVILGVFTPVPGIHQINKVFTCKMKDKSIPFEKLDPSKDGAVIKTLLNDLVGKTDMTEKKYNEQKMKINELFQSSIEENKQLSLEERELVYYLLNRFYGTISQSKADVGETDIIEFKVETHDAVPIAQKCRPMNPHIKDAFRETCEKWLQEKIIEPCSSPWTSPLVPVKKPDGSYRFATDYRKLNEVTKLDSYPIANSLELLTNSQLNTSKIFCSLDLTGAYLAVKVREEDQHKLAITTPLGTFKFLRMPFGPRNAAQTYARLMTTIFQGMWQEDKLLSFFDDHLIPGKSFVQVYFRLAEVLLKIEQANLKISPSKSKLFVTETTFLGHLIKEGCVCPAEKLTSTIKEWPIPVNITALQSFLGTCGYYRRFIKNYAAMVKPLTQLTKKDVPWSWTSLEQSIFEEMKNRLCSKPILFPPDFSNSNPFILDCDASGLAVGAVLSQLKDSSGEEHPIGYFSKSLSDTECNYSITRKELLAIILAAEHFKYFLLGKKFIIRTDHAALQWLKTSTALSGQLFRWAERLNYFDFDIIYRPGKKHTHADGLSRKPPFNNETTLKTFSSLDYEMLKSLGVTIPKTGLMAKGLQSTLSVKTRKQLLTEREGSSTRLKIQVPRDADIPTMDDVDKGSSTRLKIQVPRDEDIPTMDDEDKDEDSPQMVDNNLVLDHTDEQDIDNHGTQDEEAPSSIPTVLQGNEILKSIKNDVNMVKVINWLQAEHTPTIQDTENNEELILFRKIWGKLSTENDKLYLLDTKIDPISDDMLTLKRLVVPTGMRTRVIACLHQHPLSGHAGITRTLTLARRIAFWPSMQKDIIEAIQGCEVCIQAKRRSVDKNVVLHQTSTGEHQRLNTFYTDIVGPWPSTSSNDYKYLLTFQDAVTKYPEAVPLHNITAETVTKAVGEHLISRYGTGLKLISDRGTQFTSKLLKIACKRLGLIKVEITSFHPQANPVERLHRTLGNVIRALMFQEKAHPSDWYLFIPYALAAVRQMPLSNILGSPHFLTYGQEPITPTETFLEEDSNILSSFPTIDNMVTRFKRIQDIIHSQQQDNHEKNKKRYDSKIKSVSLQPGDWVYLHGPGNPKDAGFSRKLMNYRQGPYKVIKVLNTTTIRILVGSERSGNIKFRFEDVNKQRLLKVPTKDISKTKTPLTWKIRQRPTKTRISKERVSEDSDKDNNLLTSDYNLPISLSYYSSPHANIVREVRSNDAQENAVQDLLVLPKESEETKEELDTDKIEDPIEEPKVTPLQSPIQMSDLTQSTPTKSFIQLDASMDVPSNKRSRDALSPTDSEVNLNKKICRDVLESESESTNTQVDTSNKSWSAFDESIF
jgi:hypothetical protein